MFRKLFLVGFAVFFPPGSLLQIVWALNVAISIIALEVQVRPFRYEADSYCSLVAALATIFTLLVRPPCWIDPGAGHAKPRFGLCAFPDPLT